MAAPRKYPDEVRERSVRMVMDRPADEALTTACRRIGGQLGISHETLRGWVRQVVGGDLLSDGACPSCTRLWTGRRGAPAGPGQPREPHPRAGAGAPRRDVFGDRVVLRAWTNHPG